MYDSFYGKLQASKEKISMLDKLAGLQRSCDRELSAKSRVVVNEEIFSNNYINELENYTTESKSLKSVQRPKTVNSKRYFNKNLRLLKKDIHLYDRF